MVLNEPLKCVQIIRLAILNKVKHASLVRSKVLCKMLQQKSGHGMNGEDTLHHIVVYLYSFTYRLSGERHVAC